MFWAITLTSFYCAGLHLNVCVCVCAWVWCMGNVYADRHHGFLGIISLS